MYNFMRDQIALGRQVFVVYPLIFETEKLDYQSLEEGIELLCRIGTEYDPLSLKVTLSATLIRADYSLLPNGILWKNNRFVKRFR